MGGIAFCPKAIPSVANGLSCPAVMEVQVAEADRGDEDRQTPAKCHRDQLPPQGDEGIDEQHVRAHQEANHALVDEPCVGIENGIEDRDNHEREGERVLPGRWLRVRQHPEDEDGKDQAEYKMSEVIRAGEPTKGFTQNLLHARSLCVKVVLTVNAGRLPSMTGYRTASPRFAVDGPH